MSEAKAALPATEAAPAIAAAAPAEAAAPAAEAVAAPELLTTSEKPFLEADLSLRELRSRLLAAGLSTTGVKSELRRRLEYALEHSRAQYQSWDPVKMAWVN